jgi:hypothetical protein
MTIQTATVRVAYFNLNYNGPNFSILVDIDTDETYINKSNWTPPLDDELCYSTSEWIDIKFETLGEREYKGRTSTEINIIEE